MFTFRSYLRCYFFSLFFHTVILLTFIVGVLWMKSTHWFLRVQTVYFKLHSTQYIFFCPPISLFFSFIHSVHLFFVYLPQSIFYFLSLFLKIRMNEIYFTIVRQKEFQFHSNCIIRKLVDSTRKIGFMFWINWYKNILIPDKQFNAVAAAIAVVAPSTAWHQIATF